MSTDDTARAAGLTGPYSPVGCGADAARRSAQAGCE